MEIQDPGVKNSFHQFHPSLGSLIVEWYFRIVVRRRIIPPLGIDPRKSNISSKKSLTFGPARPSNEITSQIGFDVNEAFRFRKIFGNLEFEV